MVGLVSDALVALLNAACWLVLMVALLVASVTDMRRRIIPNECAVAVALAGLLHSAVASVVSGSAEPLQRAVLGLAAVLAVMLVTALVSARLGGLSGVGGGDVKLLSALGIWTGPLTGLMVLAGACLLSVLGWLAACLMAHIQMLSGHNAVMFDTSEPAAPPDRPTARGIPMAPAISAAATIALLLGGTVGA